MIPSVTRKNIIFVITISLWIQKKKTSSSRLVVESQPVPPLVSVGLRFKLDIFQR